MHIVLGIVVAILALVAGFGLIVFGVCVGEETERTKHQTEKDASRNDWNQTIQSQHETNATQKQVIETQGTLITTLQRSLKTTRKEMRELEQFHELTKGISSTVGNAEETIRNVAGQSSAHVALQMFDQIHQTVTWINGNKEIPEPIRRELISMLSVKGVKEDSENDALGACK